MVDVEVIGSEGCGGSGVFDGAEDELGGEGGEGGVEGPLTDFPLELAVRAVAGRGKSGEESAEGVGNVEF